jgi:Bacterial nucleoid DNA-binding protein
MNSAEFTSALAKSLHLSKEDVAKRMEEVAEIITDELTKENMVSITGFGSFETKKRNERISVHPTTRSRLLIPPKLIVNFKPSTLLKDKVKSIKS